MKSRVCLSVCVWEQELVDKRRAMMEEYRRYREAAQQLYDEQKSLRLELRGEKSPFCQKNLTLRF